MNDAMPNVTVSVDVTNPGQFFACCGLLELADRLWPGSTGWFLDKTYNIACKGTLEQLIKPLVAMELEQLDSDDNMASPLRLPPPFDLTLDWWIDDLSDGKQLKVWAGSMRNLRIARAMQKAIASVDAFEQLFEFTTVVYDPDNPNKKVEPYYFDSRRGWNAQSLDIGFAPDSLNMTTIACPAVEFLCLVGLQRFRPKTTKQRRVFEYFTWIEALPVEVATAVTGGALGHIAVSRYRFENAFRTAQKKHKSFLPATPLEVRS